jgi:hypothetical protein
VASLVANHQAAQAQLAAASALNDGRAAEAAQQFDFAADVVEGAMQAAPRAERERMQRQVQELRSRSGRARRPMSAPAARSLSLEANDEAMSDMGY